MSIAFDAKSNSGYQSGTSSASWTHTCTGSDGFLAVNVELLSLNDTVSGITYDGVSLTLIGAQNVAGGTGRVEQWGLVNPATGANSIGVTMSGFLLWVATAVSYTGVDQTTPAEAWNGNSGLAPVGGVNSVIVTTVEANDWIIAALSTNAAGTYITSGGGFNSRNKVTGSGGTGADEDTGPIASPGANTMTYSNSLSSSSWAMAGYGIRPAAVAPTLFAQSIF